MPPTRRNEPRNLPERASDEPLPETTLDLKDRALAVAAEGITIADARLPDMPLIYANEGFERITGYKIGQVLGRNCRFLQGPGTDPEATETIRNAIQNERACVVELLNYRQDGESFWNRLSITPVHDEDGTVTHFIGVQSDITKRRRAEEALAAANRRMSGDLEAAASIQRSLLPTSRPDLPGLEVAWAFRPCTELAGDIFNLFPMGEGLVGFYVLDVSGHGVPAALLSVTLSHSLSPVSGESLVLGADGSPTPPVKVVMHLNQQFQMQPTRVQYFTMIYGIFETATRRLRYVTAGHPPMILFPQSGTPRPLPASGKPVGLLADGGWKELGVDLEPGDRLCLYTDGAVEVGNAEGGELGRDRLIQVLQAHRQEPLEASVQALMAKVEGWCDICEPEDDVTVLALEVKT